jgi:hypothetical protein
MELRSLTLCSADDLDGIGKRGCILAASVMKTQTIADSILIASLALAVSLGSVVLIYFYSQGVVVEGDAVTILGLGVCASPLIALLNVVFVVRDFRNGRQEAARLAAVLSMAAAFLGVLPILLAD